MRKSILAILTIICFTTTNAQLTKADEQKLNDLLKQMTIEEKVGQMTQVTFAVIAKGGWGDTEGNIDPAALKKAIADYHVGSILNVNAHGFSVDKWNEVITQIQDEAQKTRLKIPIVYGLDGHVYNQALSNFKTRKLDNVRNRSSRARVCSKANRSQCAALGFANSR